jgi:S-adenosylmethionine-dependent methyltransferase
MQSRENIVKDYYDEHAEDEWLRLTQDAYHMLEFIVTSHYLDKYLPTGGGLILDAGGGPGRYAIYLARRGYDVVLLDLSPRCLEVAKREVKGASVEDRVKGFIEGSVENLERFNDRLFDAVLCLGPLSHLIEPSDRQRAAGEIARVVKNNAPIFASVASRYGVFRAFLQIVPDELVDPSHEELFSVGIHRGHPTPHKGGKGFSTVDAYFFLPQELEALFEGVGVETLEMVSCEGLSSRLQQDTNKLYEDKAKWDRWIKLVLDTCNDRTLLGMGDHILYVGKRGNELK